MRIIKDAIAWLRANKVTSSRPVEEALFLTEGRSSICLGTTGYGKGVDPAAIPESDKVALALQTHAIALELAESQKPGR